MKSRLLLLPVVSALMIGLAACAGPSTPSASPTPSVGASDSSSPEATSQPAASTIEQVAAVDFQPYEGLSSAEVAALPDAEQAKYVALQNILNFEAYKKSWDRWPDTRDQSIPEISIDSDPQDIANYITWQQRLAFSFTGDERESYIQASRYNGTESYLYPEFQRFSTESPTRWVGEAAAQNNVFPLVTATGAEELSVNSDSTATRVVTVEGSTGGTRAVTYYYNEVTLSDGTVVPIWRGE